MALRTVRGCHEAGLKASLKTRGEGGCREIGRAVVAAQWL